MRPTFATLALALSAAVTVGGTAHAQTAPPVWDDFESYQVGSGIAGQGPWGVWEGDLAYDSYVSDTRAYSGMRSLEIVGASDTVLETKRMTNGCYMVKARQYIPPNFSGVHFFIMLNTYAQGGPYVWSVQLEFDATTGYINDHDYTKPIRPYVKSRWVELGVKVDLFDDIGTLFYDGQVLYSDVWSTHVHPDGTPTVEALDLYANHSSSVFYDDVEIRPCLSLTGPDPGFPGLRNEFVVDGATPGSTVAVLYGTQIAPYVIPGCPGSVLPFTDPELIGQAVANGAGVATIARTIPVQASGRTATFAAVERTKCRVSNPVEHTFP